jgi:hypothetical protein
MPAFNNKAKRVLIFNPSKRLIAIVGSARAAAKMLGINIQPIHYACTGKCISSNGFYFRHLSDDIEITLEDLGVLKVDEYDQLCGIERRVFKNRSMSRAGMKYKKHYVLPKNIEENENNPSEGDQ